MSSILYGCESWFNGNIKPMENLYNMCIKHLLGVRKTTNTNLCMVELGFPPLKALVKQRQQKFFKNMSASRRDMVDDPLNLMLRVTIGSNTITSRYLKELLDSEVNYISEGMNNTVNNINNSDSSKCIYYKSINPNMQVHNVYSIKCRIDELERTSWTKLRLSAHSLGIETGRWNRRGRGRLPVEERLCQCGQVQTERHVLEECPRSQHIRDLHSFNSMENLILERDDYANVCHIVHSILDLYK